MKRLLLIVPLLILALAVGCSSTAKTKSEGKPSGTAKSMVAPMATPSPAIVSQAGAKAGEATRGAVEAAPAQAPSIAADQSASDAGGGASDQIFDRKIIYDADLALKVKDVGDSFEAVRGIAKSAGGFVLDSSFHYEGERRVATVRLRVPAEGFDDALAKLRRLGVEVEQENSSAKDVTEEFTDLEARLRNLEATEAQYLTFLRQAKNIDEVLRVQQQLTAIRDQIERTKGRMNVLNRLSEMATISVRLYPVEAAAKAKPSGWSASRVAGDAWQSSLHVIRAIGTGVITVAVYTWWLWLLAIAGLVLWRLLRAQREHSSQGG